MLRSMLAAGLTGAVALSAAAPVLAQSAPPRAGVVQIFGNDKCPTNTDGEEIIVCERLDERERFRIPSTLRELRDTPENTSWAVRTEDALNQGFSGAGTCSTVGSAGQTGCFVRAAKAGKAEVKARAKAEDNLPIE